MIALRTGHAKAMAIVERQGAQRRLSRLAQQLQDVDHLDKLGRADLKIAMRSAFSVMERCDQVLSPICEPELPKLPTSTEADTALRHARMHQLLDLLSDLPRSCHESARVLRRALHAELRGPSIGRAREG